VLVTKINPLSSKLITREIPISEVQYHSWLISTMPIQQAFPWLNEDHCEFLMTGLTPEDWANIFNN